MRLQSPPLLFASVDALEGLYVFLTSTAELVRTIYSLSSLSVRSISELLFDRALLSIVHPQLSMVAIPMVEMG